MFFEKEIENIGAVVKETSTQVPHSRILDSEGRSKSPLNRSKVHNHSKSEKSLSRGKQNKSAAAIGGGRVRED